MGSLIQADGSIQSARPACAQKDTDAESPAGKMLSRAGGAIAAELRDAWKTSDTTAAVWIARALAAGAMLRGDHAFTRERHYFLSAALRDAWLATDALLPTSALERRAYDMLRDGRLYLTPADLAADFKTTRAFASRAIHRIEQFGLTVRRIVGARVYFFVDAEAARTCPTDVLLGSGYHMACDRIGKASVDGAGNAKNNIVIGKAATKKKHAGTRLIGEVIGMDTTPVQRENRVYPIARWQELELPPETRWPSFKSSPLGSNPLTGKSWGAA